MTEPIVLSPGDAAARLVDHMGLRRFRRARGARGVRQLLSELRCIQLDPLDPMGTNADLVTLARVQGVSRGSVHDHLLPGYAFEHFAKERCLLPASAFPYYRTQAVETPWWRSKERLARVDASVIEAVFREVRARGPVSAADLEDRGRVAPIDWSGWKGTSSAATMALEILWTQCRVVVAGRRGREKVYDDPARALPDVHRKKPATDFARWALRERVAAAGLLARAGGATWSMLGDTRTDGTVDAALSEGELVEVRVGGSTRPYLTTPAFFEGRRGRDDGAMRILGPLDPLLWDRALVRHAFGFDYVWEVYKPAATRRFGWYVCPLLHEGQLVGRIEGRVVNSTLRIDNVWEERRGSVATDALDQALARHAEACGSKAVKRPKRFRRAQS